MSSFSFSFPEDRERGFFKTKKPLSLGSLFLVIAVTSLLFERSRRGVGVRPFEKAEPRWVPLLVRIQVTLVGVLIDEAHDRDDDEQNCDRPHPDCHTLIPGTAHYIKDGHSRPIVLEDDFNFLAALTSCMPVPPHDKK